MTAIEIVATLFGLLCVVLTIRQNIWCWPMGLVQVTLFIWIFYDARLYSDVLLHVIYIGLGVYGWWYWLRRPEQIADHAGVPVTKLRTVTLGAWLLVGIVGTFVLGLVMHRFAGASLPYWDAATTVFSLIAQYLLARKWLESWWFWIVVDVIAIGVYLAKDLYVTSGLYAVFLVLAVLGWMSWRRSLTSLNQTGATGPAGVREPAGVADPTGSV